MKPEIAIQTMQLSPEQLAAVDSDARQIVCLAGPGAGKSSTLIARILKLIERGAKPSEIACITYTAAAAKVLQDRIGKVKLGACSTLHALTFRMLSQHGTLIGLPARLSICDDDSREGIVETIMAEMGVKCPVKKVLALLGDPKWIENRPGSKSKEALVAIAYYQSLRAAGLLDFESMLFYFERLLRMHGSVWPYKHAFIDEMQDSSDADMAIYMAMPCETRFLVGDPDQSVFKFRGANVENILRLTNTQEWSVMKLETNFRCLSAICNAANNLIRHNGIRYDKRTIAATEGGSVSVHRFESPVAEMAFVANDLAKCDDVKDCAVLCRTNFLARQFSDYLKGLGIPVAERKQVIVPKDWGRAKMLLSVLANPYSDFIVHQYLVDKEGRKKADQIRNQAAMKMTSINEHMAKRFSQNLQSSVLDDEGISAESRQRIHDAARQLSDAGEWSIPELLLYVNTQEDVSLEIGVGVHVGTIHGFKGKEADTVYLCGFEDETIPGKRDDDVSESRRLAFVGVTRARERLVITWSSARPQSRGPNIVPPGTRSARI